MKKNKNALIFFWVMVMVGMLALIGGSLLKVVSKDVFTAEYLKYSTQAFFLADAGINHAFSQLKADFSDTTAIGHTFNFGSYTGSYSVVITANGNNKIATSTSNIKGAVRTVVAEFIGPPSYEAFNYAVFANRNVSSFSGSLFTGSEVTINGDLFANGDMSITVFLWNDIFRAKAYNGRSGSCNAYLHTPSTIKVFGVGTITADGGFNKAGSTIPFPTINFEYYRNLAQNGGLYYSSGQTWRNVNLNPGNGVTYVNGNVIFRRSLFNPNNTVTGCLVVNGYVFINPLTTVTQTRNGSHTNYPAVLAQGDIYGTGRLNFNGLIYSKGGSILVRVGTGTGCIMASRDAEIVDIFGHLTEIWSRENPPDLLQTPVSLAAWSE